MQLRKSLKSIFKTIKNWLKNISMKSISQEEKLFITRAKNDKLSIICRISAIKQITHQKTLYELATYDKDHRIRKEATKRIHTEKYLKSIATYNDKPIVRALAVTNLRNNDKFLFKIALSEGEPIVIRAALEAMQDIETLNEVISLPNIKAEYKEIAEFRISQITAALKEDFWI